MSSVCCLALGEISILPSLNVVCQEKDILSLTDNANEHCNFTALFRPNARYPVSGTQASSRGGMDIRFPALPPGSAETWPENKGNKTSEYCLSMRMVITTWDHFKHLQLGSELEWRDAMGKTGSSWQSFWEGNVVWLAFSVFPQQTLCPAPTSLIRTLLWFISRGLGLMTLSFG